MAYFLLFSSLMLTIGLIPVVTRVGDKSAGKMGAIEQAVTLIYFMIVCGCWTITIYLINNP